MKSSTPLQLTLSVNFYRLQADFLLLLLLLLVPLLLFLQLYIFYFKHFKAVLVKFFHSFSPQVVFSSPLCFSLSSCKTVHCSFNHMTPITAQVVYTGLSELIWNQVSERDYLMNHFINLQTSSWQTNKLYWIWTLRAVPPCLSMSPERPSN